MEVALHNKSSIYWGLYQTVRIRQLVWHVCGAGKSGKAGGNILISFRTSVPLAVVLVPHSEAAVCSEEWCRTEARRMAYVCGRVGFLTTYLKRKLRLMISSFFLYARPCVPLTALKPVSTISWSSVWWSCHWRWPRHFNPLSSTIPKCRTFKRLRCMKNFLQSTWGHYILYADRFSNDEQLLRRLFLW